MTNGPIGNACDRPINFQNGTIPDVSGGIRDWFQPMIFEQIVKTTSGFQVVETTTPIAFQGFVQPLQARQLFLKSEGQRAWTWFQVFADPALPLQVDDVGIWNGKQTRVMARKDYALFGIIEYQWVQDWTGSGPITA